ncbi:aldehyde dehydrogenase EutE [Tissierella sp. MSJ-40]|uniref:Aldehyde dehydrogenase EutE n=1 Tax=Tissierella simiarum TaxID=2841534 RepID=A0ABS6E4R4_9FIRM|nr:aldehyde dehydrogenase family protein [Tissierella simiarum]MBU5437541.1 aldehyde dehydrogenase EutE [Tissierella simiarum]
MNIDVSLVEEVVRKVMKEFNGIEQVRTSDNYGIFGTMDEAIDAAYLAQKEYLRCSISDRERYIKAIREVILKEENLEYLSRLAVEETGMGKYEHKYIKNKLAAEKTPGTEDLVTEAMAGDDGLTLIELSPFGVIGSITPTTNPTETIISNSIGMLAAGNSVVFSPHPKSKRVCIDIIKMINKALKVEGAPRNLVVMVEEPSIENTNILMSHPKINMIVTTGGPAIVKKAMSTGKKAIGAGAGNPPVVVDETANIEKAAVDIINGCSFDNNLPCIAEKEVISVDSITDYLIFNMKKSGAYEIQDKDVLDKLTSLVVDENGAPNKDLVGKSAIYILNKIGIEADKDIKVIIAETAKEHPLVQHELMMPILPIVRANDVDEAINIAVEVEHGNRHTAMMHSTNVEKLTKMAKLIQTTIFVKNGPSYAGIGVGGEGYSTFTIAGPTGEGLTSPKSFARRRRCVLVGGFHIK